MPFHPGDTDTRPYLFDAAGIVAFATAAGDMNPLHHDAAIAARSRFKTLIASGPHMTAVLMGAGASFLSREHEAVGLEFTFRFERAIPAGTQTTLGWTILTAEPSASLGGTLVTCEGAITGAGGRQHVFATGKAVVWDKRLQSG